MILRAVLCALLAVSALAIRTTEPAHAQRPALGRSNALVHEGSFKVPRGDFGSPQYHGFNYGGTALSFHPGRRSLFIVGHTHDQMVAEVSIPAPGGTATVLQPFVDPLAGRLNLINPTDTTSKRIGGTLVWNDRLLVSAYSYYDGQGSQVLSHFVRSSLLTDTAVQGPLRVGPLGAGFYSGYMGVVPSEWQALLGGSAVTGNAALSVISRTSYGPALFAFDPDRLSPSAAQPLVYYPEAHPTLGRWDAANEFFGGADSIRGVAIIPGTDTVMFFGRHGTTFCYGNGVKDRSLHGRPAENGVDKLCYDEVDASKGVHGYPYEASAWLYDANDLAAVRAKKRQPWEVKPYARLQLPNITREVGGATIDPESRRIYVTEMYADGDLPLVHVFSARP